MLNVFWARRLTPGGHTVRLISAVATALFAANFASPSAAVTFDAFSSFTGTSVGGAFSYGTYDGLNFTPFNDAPGCAGLISDVICTSNGFLPAAFKSTSGPHQSGTVLVPGDALVLHPGPNAGQAAAVLYTAPTTGTLSLTFSAFSADTNPSGVNVLFFFPGGPHFQLVHLPSALPYTFGASLGQVSAGFQLGFAVDYDGTYNNDSTAINLAVSQVPEPATWGLMIAGFGMTGFAARRRRTALAA